MTGCKKRSLEKTSSWLMRPSFRYSRKIVKPLNPSHLCGYRSGRYGPGIVLYEYQPSRAKEHPAGFLKDFKRYLQTDGYAGYNGLSNVTNVGYLAHVK